MSNPHHKTTVPKWIIRLHRDEYITEKIEAYNVAIEALRLHEPADGDPLGIAWTLRNSLANKLDKEIQQWVNKFSHNRPE
jgi:hypothetical protein